MIVYIELRGPLARHAPPGGSGGKVAVDVPKGATVKEILGLMGIPPGSVGMVAASGRKTTLDSSPADNDVITVYPVVAGG